VVLFPIAFVWLAVVMIWLIRNSLDDPDVPREERDRRRWRPRPRRPDDRAPKAHRTRRRSNGRIPG